MNNNLYSVFILLRAISTGRMRLYYLFIICVFIDILIVNSLFINPE